VAFVNGIDSAGDCVPRFDVHGSHLSNDTDRLVRFPSFILTLRVPRPWLISSRSLKQTLVCFLSPRLARVKPRVHSAYTLSRTSTDVDMTRGSSTGEFGLASLQECT